ncbi:hypothetical protein SHELI_v1c10750 [Spiroplasma helicoides]|uniref:Aminotransferase class V domain-containing protein n=1 Tax=Spiroplasma helicoides TaxID=216938 RepID=A0A1B3SM66_9MOLU|nr:aminotransferase class V-fold PLP-dependent enzyme [Spiroplasma helicoides]AOG61022.1 hypothetical protein SHELI_v1c10750 [Spiroplasma helicoides]
MKKQILFTPGPQANHGEMTRENIFHRSQQSVELLNKTRDILKKIFGSEYVFAVPSSALELMNIFVTSLNKDLLLNKKIAVIWSGYWSDKIIKVLTDNGFIVDEISEDIRSYNEDQLEEYFKTTKYDLFFGLVCETSNGKLYEYETIYKVMKKYNKLLFLDAVSYAIFYRKNNDLNQHADFVLMSSAKNFLSSPGFAFLTMRKNYTDYEIFAKNTYLSLDLYWHYEQESGQLPHTFHTVLLSYIYEDLLFTYMNKKEICQKIDKLKSIVDTQMKEIGFELYNKENWDVNNLSVYVCSDGIDATKLIKYLEQHDICVGSDMAKINSFRLCISYKNTEEEINLLCKLIKDYINN